MTRLKTLIVSLAVGSLFASAAVFADDCSEALVAESCACSHARSDRERRRNSYEISRQRSRSGKQKTARLQVPPRAKDSDTERSQAQR